MKRRFPALVLVTSLVIATLCHAQETSTAPPLAEATGLPFEDGDRVLFLGDSITQDGKYVAFLEAYLWAKYPDKQITIVNMGVSAETVARTTEPNHPPRPWAHDRVDNALAIAKPNWVFICYGMNDGIYYPPRQDVQNAYVDEMGRLIERIKPTKAKVILLSPPPFDPFSKPIKAVKPPGEKIYGYNATYRLYDDTLIFLGGLARGAYEDEVHQCIDIHTPLQNYISTARAKRPGYRYGDGVHPPVDAHLVWALSLLEALGEDRKAAYAVLKSLTGVSIKTDEEINSSGNAKSILWRRLLKRFNRLSKAYRDNTRPETKATPPNLKEAIALAGKLETQLRKEVRSAAKIMIKN